MISGAFLLNPEKQMTLGFLFHKYISRIVLAFVFWSAIYSISLNIMKFRSFSAEFLVSVLKDFLIGHYHLWFLFMIFGLYLVSPFLKKITEERRLSEYYIFLFLIFGLLIPFLQKSSLFSVTAVLTERMHFHFVLGFSGYFVIGFFLLTHSIATWLKVLIYIAGVTGTLATIIFTSLISIAGNTPNEFFYSYLSPNVAASSIAIFLFFKEKVSRITLPVRLSKSISKLSLCAFGIYLVHDFYNIALKAVGLTTLSFNPLFSVPIISIIVFLLSLATILLLKRIPLLRRFIM